MGKLMPNKELNILLFAQAIFNNYRNSEFVYTEEAKLKDRELLAGACEQFLKIFNIQKGGDQNGMQEVREEGRSEKGCGEETMQEV